MITGILIIARLGSTRLSQKHLIEVKGKTFIEWLALRYLSKFNNEVKANNVKIIIATSVLEENKKFEEIFKNSLVEVFYGSNTNIPLRQLECAKQYNLDQIISIDGDDILCSTEAASIVYNKLYSGVSAIKTEGLPLGMNVIGYKTKYLNMCVNNHTQDSKFETGWGRIFDENLQSINIGNYNLNEQLRFTLDYQVDADFFTNIINHFDNKIIALSDSDLIKYVVDNLIFQINSSVSEIYWENFNRSKQNEI